MKSKAQQQAEQERNAARNQREAQELANQIPAPIAFGNTDPNDPYNKRVAWLRERSRKAATNRLREAARYETAPIPGMEPAKRQPPAEQPKKEWGDEVADTVLNPLTGKTKKVARRWFGING